VGATRGRGLVAHGLAREGRWWDDAAGRLNPLGSYERACSAFFLCPGRASQPYIPAWGMGWGMGLFLRCGLWSRVVGGAPRPVRLRAVCTALWLFCAAAAAHGAVRPAHLVIVCVCGSACVCVLL
jgi:hypothetical protein